MTTPTRILPLITLVLLGLTATPVRSQPSDSTSALATLSDANPDSIGQQASTLLRQISHLTAEYRGYRSRLASASVEDSLVLSVQIDARIQDFMEKLPLLANYYPSEAGSPGERELRTGIEEIYNRVTGDIWDLIAADRAEIDQLRARRTSAAPGERIQLEYLISRQQQRVDEVTAFAGQHLQTMADLGLDVTQARATYREVLQERANELVGRILLGTERIKVFHFQLKDQAGDADLALLVSATKSSLSTNTESLEKLIGLMEHVGIATQEYRTELLAVTQDLASGILDVRVTATLLRRFWLQTSHWVVSNGPTYLVKFLIFIAIIFAGRLLAKLVHKAVDKSLGRARINISQLLRRTIVSSAHNVVVGLALMIALSQLGLNLGPLLAGFGVVGFILGFAMQDSLSNFASGLMILFYRPYDVGDLVDISGVFGKVEHMSLVSTSILTLDNQKLVVPNSKIWGDVIKNVTDQHIRRVDMVFGIGYSDDIPKAEEILAAILAEHDKVLDRPEPMVRLHELNDSSVDFVVRPWVKTDDYWDVYWDVTRAVKMRFDAEEISIPFPQRDVHIYNEDQPAGES